MVRRARELWLKTAVIMIGMGPPPRSALLLRSSRLASGGGEPPAPYSEIVPNGSISLYRCHAAAAKLFQVFPGGVEVLIFWSEGRYLVSKFLVFSRGSSRGGYLAGLVRNLLIYVCSPSWHTCHSGV